MIRSDRMFFHLKRSCSKFLPGCAVHGCPHRWERSAYSGQIKAQTGATWDSFHVQSCSILFWNGRSCRKTLFDSVWSKILGVVAQIHADWSVGIPSRLIFFLISCIGIRLRSWISSKFVFLLLVPIVRNRELTSLTSLIPPFMVMECHGFFAAIVNYLEHSKKRQLGTYFL